MNEIKVGDILAGTWGYSMVIPVFYQVVKVTDKRIKLVELEKRMVSHDGYGQRGYEVPIQAVRDLDAEDVIARPSKDEKGEWVVGNKSDHLYIKKWDGRPVWADYCD